MLSLIRAAAVQMDVYIGENDRNLQRVLQKLEEAAKNGAHLVVFPECALSGYCFASLAEALPFADTHTGKRCHEFDNKCDSLAVTGVLGFLETDGEKCFNSALIYHRELQIAPYTKTHLPTLGVDRYVSPGDQLATNPAAFGRLGV